MADVLAYWFFQVTYHVHAKLPFGWKPSKEHLGSLSYIGMMYEFMGGHSRRHVSSSYKKPEKKPAKKQNHLKLVKTD